ncbi:hypothetical protein ACFQ69_34615 [Streptomyces sp. NPDC056470]|uniref:hypothetical protein n=1 Tax=Streptomyces sp. NPDC056470 TaxID=3345831 RepID=UPI003676EEDF
MPSDLPTRRRASRPQPVPSPTSGDAAFDDILNVFAQQVGDATQAAADPRGRRKLRGISFEFDHDRRSVHNMAGTTGYSLASNWFTQLLAQLVVAKQVTRSQLCVFLYVAGGQVPGTGTAQYTQQQITDGLNELIKDKPESPKISRSTVNRAIKMLCEYKWLEQLGNGNIRLNVTLWFQGNSTAQHEVLAEIAADHGGDPEAFPNGIGPEPPRQEEFDFGEEMYGEGRRTG